MATEVERLVVLMEANAAGMQRQLEQAQRNSDRQLASLERRFNQSAAKVNKSFQDMARNVQVALAAIGVGSIVKDATKLADAWTNAGNKLRGLGLDSAAVASKQAELADLAVKTQTTYAATIDLYSTLLRSNEQLNISEEKRLAVTETINKAIQIGGASASQASAIVLQLGQALGSGVLQGDEFRSLRENSPILVKAIADEFGVGTAALKKLAAEGELTSDRLIKAFLSVKPAIDQSFAATNTSVGSAFVNLETKLTQYVGQTNEATGATKGLVDVINHVADNIDEFAEAAVVAGTVLLGGLAGAAVVGGVSLLATNIAAVTAGLTAMQVAAAGGATAMRALGAGMAFFGGPIGLAVIALGAGLAYLALKSSDANVQMEESRKVADRLAPVWAKLKTVNDELSKAEGDRAKQLVTTQQELIATANREVELAKARLQAASAALAEADANRVASGSFAIGEGAGFGDAMEVGAKEAGVRAARAALKAAQDELTKNLPTVDIGADLNPGGPAKGSGGEKDKAKAIKTTTAELERRHAITMAEADGNRILADYLRDQEEILSRTTAYQESGLKTTQAQAKATEEVFAEREASRAKEAFDGWQQSMRDAFAVIDSAPGSVVGLEEDLQRLREQFDLIKAAGGEQQWLRTYADRLEEITRRTGDAAAALEELRNLEGLTAEDRARAEYRIQGAARQARELRDEELQKPFRYDEIRDDVKGALRQAFETGDWADAFKDKLQGALTRALDRSLDRFVDGLFDAMSQTGSSGGGGGNWISGAISAIGKFFGGGKANGGPVSPGMFYRVNENTPNSEWFSPKVPGTIFPSLPQIKVPSAGAASMPIIMNDNRTMTFTGTPNETIKALTDAMARDKASRYAETVQIVHSATRRRQ